MIELYRFQDAFFDKKVRPGFVVNGRLFVLSSVRPTGIRPYVEVKHGREGFIVEAFNKEIHKVDNQIHSVLELSKEHIAQIESAFGLSLEGYLI